MKEIIDEIAHKTALEVLHKGKADIDLIEVFIRQAIRDGIKLSGRTVTKTGKKNPNRDYVSE